MKIESGTRRGPSLMLLLSWFLLTSNFAIELYMFTGGVVFVVIAVIVHGEPTKTDSFLLSVEVSLSLLSFPLLFKNRLTEVPLTVTFISRR